MLTRIIVEGDVVATIARRRVGRITAIGALPPPQDGRGSRAGAAGGQDDAAAAPARGATASGRARG